MYSDDKSPVAFTVGGLTAIGDVMVVLCLVIIVFHAGTTHTFLRERPFPDRRETRPPDEQVGATVQLGPGRSLLVNGNPTQLEQLVTTLGEMPEGAVLELRTRLPVDYQFHYRVRYQLRRQGYPLREPPPMSRDELTDQQERNRT